MKLSKLEFRDSRLARWLYSQNLQRGPPLGKCKEVPLRYALFFITDMLMRY